MAQHPEHDKEYREGIAHITIVVKDLDAAVKKWEKIVGVPASSHSTGRENWNVASFRAYGTRIELVSPTNDNNPIARRLASAGEGIASLAFRFDDRAEALKRQDDAGLRLINYPGEGKELKGEIFVHPSETGGVLLSIIQGE